MFSSTTTTTSSSNHALIWLCFSTLQKSVASVNTNVRQNFMWTVQHAPLTWKVCILSMMTHLHHVMHRARRATRGQSGDSGGRWLDTWPYHCARLTSQARAVNGSPRRIPHLLSRDTVDEVTIVARILPFHQTMSRLVCHTSCGWSLQRWTGSLLMGNCSKLWHSFTLLLLKLSQQQHRRHHHFCRRYWLCQCI